MITTESYQLTFEYFFNTLGDDRVDDLSYIENLESVLVHYSKCHANGFKECIKSILEKEYGRDKEYIAERLLKGRSVHWLRSRKSVAKICVDSQLHDQFIILCNNIRTNLR